MPHKVKKRVLVVDDEALIRWTLRERLNALGFEVMEAADASQALDQISHDGICAALLDLRLPDLSGLEVLKAFRVHHPDCPVWIMTAYGSAAEEQIATDLGACGFVHKPFDADDLAHEVQQALDN